MPSELKKAEVKAYLKFVEFPARKGDLEEKAFYAGAPRSFLDDLQKLPDKSYFSIQDIEKHISELNIQ